MLLLAGLVLSGGLSGCSDDPAAAASPAAASASADAALPEVLATIGGQPVTLADVRARVGDDLDQNEIRYQIAQHRLVDGALQDILRELVLGGEARRQGKTIEQLVAAEAGGNLDPSAVEVAAWYQENPDKVGGRPLEQIRGQIADYLRTERMKAATDKLTARLNRERNVTVNLEPYRLAMNNDGAPAKGPASAPVTLVEFSDFQCPFCKRFVPTLQQVERQYGDRVRIVYRQFPIPSIHPDAFKAAEASLCAHEQGQFWALHDLMFEEQDRLTVRDLKAKAGRVGLDRRRFDACLDSGRHTERVQDDMREAKRLGVTGTPALFVNGVPLEGGALPFDAAARAIEQELARADRH